MPAEPTSLVPVARDPEDPGLALGRGAPNVAWTIGQADRIYNVLLAGGQGSGKSSLLLRVALNDILAPNTATVVLDMKGSLSERLLRLTPPDVEKRWWDGELAGWQLGTKRVWYLDLGRPGFGLTPLQVEPGWEPALLADEFSRIADAICRALLDLFPGQIMGSSEDLIERAVVGTMAIAWYEHTQRCDRDGVVPTSRGFSGSFEVLSQMFAPTDRFDAEEASNKARRRVRPNRWHQAAGRACQRLPNLDQVADTLLYEIPRQARDNLGDIAKRMEAPANKIRPLVGAAASVRRFVGHPERLSLRSVIEAHDTLIVNPRIELIGEDQASILTNFVVHMLDLQLKRQVATPRSQRPRVSLIIDEAHRLVTDTLITMVATHREAGLTVAAAVQYVSQLGAEASTSARRERIVKGVGNLLQTKVLFRMSDSEDADRHSQIFRSVYETMVRADPTSRARMPFDPARMQTLRDHHALVSLVCSADRANTTGLLDTGSGATRLPAFVTQTYRMPEIEEIADTWRAHHLDLQGQVFQRYPEDMSALAVHDVPAGLGGEGEAVTEPHVRTRAGARAQPAAHTDDGAHDAGETKDAAASSHGDESPPASGERLGGVRVERDEEREPTGPALGESPVLRFACLPTQRHLPEGDAEPATATARDALGEVAIFDGVTRLPDWTVAGDRARSEAKTAAAQAHEQAVATGQAAGRDDGQVKRLAERHARKAAAESLADHQDARWRTPAAELELSEPDVHTLEVIARVRLAAPRLLCHLLDEPTTDRTVRKRLTRLHDAGLTAHADVAIEGRRGRRPRVVTIGPRGLEHLRARHQGLRPDHDPPPYLNAERKLPTPGKGSEIPHELAIQLTLVALRQYGGTQVRLHWHTTRMPGGRWDVGMVHDNPRDRTLRLADITPGPGLSVRGEQLDAQPTLEPDLSVQLQGPVGEERAVIDLLLEVDRTDRGAYNREKFVAYDQFLGGWCLRTRRWGRERTARPLVVFVARTPQAALTLLHTADAAMTLGFGERGRYDPATFTYPGRAHATFTCLPWLLAGHAFALRLPDLPPDVRGEGSPLRPERSALLPERWWVFRTT